jgi:hypothetical protein
MRAISTFGARLPARFHAGLLGGALLVVLALASGCDASAEYCLTSPDVTVDHFVMCDKSCSKGNEASCKRARELEGRLCHEKFSVYHCMRGCKSGDAVACARAQAAMR